MNVELACDARAEIGEGPIWDERTQRLHWVDIRAGLVHRFAPADSSDATLDLGQPVGCIGLGALGGLVAAVRDGFMVLQAGCEAPNQLIEVERDRPENRMNDGRCDPAGRFWAATMAWDHTPRAGSLYRLEAHGEALGATQVLDGLTIANGLDWSPDGRLLYYIDSDTQRVDVFDFDIDEGALRRRRPFVLIPIADGLPDGMVVDSDGCIWVALFGAGRVRRYTPSGQVDLEVVLPVSLVTSMTFGGADLADLYITTARHRLTDEERARQTHAGSVFVCRPGPRGLPPHRFRWA